MSENGIFESKERWWAEAKDNKHEGVFAVKKVLDEQQAYRRQANLRHARLYGNVEVAGFTPATYSRPMNAVPVGASAPLNVIKAAIDTVAAKIVKNRPRPSFNTAGAGWDLRQKAKKLNKFTQGQFYEARAYELGKKMAFDAMKFGTGIAFVCEYRGRVHAERVLPDEMLVDDAEAIYGCPRQMLRVRSISRDVLLKMFPEKAELIRQAKRTETDVGMGKVLGDMVEVVQSWHLPSEDVTKDMKAKDHDGRYVMAVNTATLVDDEYRWEEFPFVALRWSEPTLGWWGTGLAEDLVGIQLSLNKIHKRIQDVMRRHGPRILVRKGSVPKEHITNSGVDVLQVDNPSDVVTVAQNSVPAEWFSERDRQYQLAFERAGVSQLSATAKKPAGLDAAVALREYNDIETERFVLFGQNYEQFFLDLGKLMIRQARDLTRWDADDGEEKKDYEVKIPGKKFVESIKWSDIDLDDDEYVMQCFPVSSLPSSPAARRQEVSEWMSAGLIEKEEGRRLLNFPDLEESTSLAVAAYEDCDRVIDSIVEHNKYEPPEPYQNLMLLHSRAQSAYLRARSEECPPERLEKLQELMSQCRDLMQKASAEQAANSPPPPGAQGPAADAPPPQAGPPMPPGAQPAAA